MRGCIFICSWHKYSSIITTSATISMDQIISVLLFLNSCGVWAGSDPAHYMCLCCSSQVRVNWKSVSWAEVCERVLAGVFCQTKIQVFAFRGKDAMGGNATFGKHKKRFWSLFLAWKFRGCSYEISLRHALGCVRTWTRILQCSWA